MGHSSFRSVRNLNFQPDSNKELTKGKLADDKEIRRGKDDDLIIEDNTIYEIDRECFEKKKRQKKNKF